jgi:murein DD-endopeptidase MepM/ murein hydrolase activator NlpD
VTWRPVERRAVRASARVRLSILAGLVAVNLVVIWYHGDPRDNLASREAEAEEPAPRSGAQTAEAESDSSGQLSRLVEPGSVSGFSSAIDPLAGMRTPARVKRVEVAGLKRGQTVAAALSSLGAGGEDVQTALASLAGLVSFRSLQPGDLLKARFDANDRLVSVDVHASLLERARAERRDGSWEAAPIDVQVDEVMSQVSGSVQTSLWDALIGAGEQPRLVSDIVEIFGWEIDFYREVYPGDRFRLLVDKRYVDGELLGYGPVHAAELVSDGVAHRAFRFERADGGIAYYDEEGRSMRKQLLKSPLEYGRMTSGFGKRRHPILGYTRAHNGVDYGVPSGTPVWSVGDGRVIRSGWSNGFGKVIEIRHANGWVSQYAHLSKRLVKTGDRVAQKDIIGKVGSTGLSTGPHLHYGLKKNGSYVNPAAQRFEREKPLTGQDLVRFRRQVERLRAGLDEIHIAESSRRESAREG